MSRKKGGNPCGSVDIPVFVDPLSLEIGSRLDEALIQSLEVNNRGLDPIFWCEVGGSLGRMSSPVQPLVRVGSPGHPKEVGDCYP